MPQRTSPFRRRLVRLLLLSLAGCALAGLGRREPRQSSERSPSVPPEASPAPVPDPPQRRRSAPRRLAASVAIAALFFAGGAFSALAGDEVTRFLEQGTESVAAPAAESPEAGVQPSGEPAPPEEAGGQVLRCNTGCVIARPDPEDDPEDEPQPATAAAAAAAGSPPGQTAPEPAAGVQHAAAPSTESRAAEAEPAPETSAGARPLEPLSGRPGRPRGLAARAAKPARKRAEAPPAPDPEIAVPGLAATIWLNKPVPDPTPPSLRLSATFALRLRAAARHTGVDWALVLGVLRAQGARGSAPARPPTVREVAQRLASLGARKDAWTAALAFTGRTALADRAVALARYYRAIGLEALVSGLQEARGRLAERLLRDPRVDLYAGGRGDVTAGRIDVRVLALVTYLAETYGQVTVSSLFTGHRLYARHGVVSAHVYGHAVDIAALGGVPIAGNQEPGGLVEQAVRTILLLPAEMQPRQVISLLGLGGPSFPLGDHADHIHVGYEW